MLRRCGHGLTALSQGDRPGRGDSLGLPSCRGARGPPGLPVYMTPLISTDMLILLLPLGLVTFAAESWRLSQAAGRGNTPRQQTRSRVDPRAAGHQHAQQVLAKRPRRKNVSLSAGFSPDESEATSDARLSPRCLTAAERSGPDARQPRCGDARVASGLRYHKRHLAGAGAKGPRVRALPAASALAVRQVPRRLTGPQGKSVFCFTKRPARTPLYTPGSGLSGPGARVSGPTRIFSHSGGTKTASPC